MRSPPPFRSTAWFNNLTLFSAEDILELSKAVEPLCDCARAEEMAWDLDNVLASALEFEYPEHSVAHEQLYTGIANDIRRLAKKLGLPTSSSGILSRFPVGRSIDTPTNVPDELAWLLKAGSDAIRSSKDFALVIAKSLDNPEDPGDWYNWEDVTHVKSESSLGRTESSLGPSDQKTESLNDMKAAIEAQRPLLKAALAEVKLPLASIPLDVQLETLFYMASLRMDPVDAVDLAIIRSASRAISSGDETYHLREERRQAFCETQLTALPSLLGLALGATEEAIRQIEVRSQYENWNRRFLRCLFEGLVMAHNDYFKRPPQVRDKDNLPNGSGVTWTKGILKIAANKIDRAFLNCEQTPPEVQRDAIRLVKAAASLAQATIADRLEEAKKYIFNGKTSVPEPEDEELCLATILARNARKQSS